MVFDQVSHSNAYYLHANVKIVSMLMHEIVHRLLKISYNLSEYDDISNLQVI